MDTKLKFMSTLTVEEFKEKFEVEKIRVHKNPKTNKLFFTFGTSGVGAVAIKGIPSKPLLSHVESEEGATFWLLHEQVEGAPQVAEF